MLESTDVLKNTIKQGVQNGEFGLMIGEKVRYMEPVLEEVTEDAQVLRKEIAVEKKRELGKIIEEFPSKLPIVEEKPLPGMIKRIKLVAKVPWDKLSDLMRGVLSPLHIEEADIGKLEIKIEATSKKGIKKENVDLKIKETLKQIKAEIIEEEIE